MSKVLGMSNGRGIDPYAYNPSVDWDAKCVAKSLSNICRYNGHYGWISVAEHCLTVSQIMGLRYDELFSNRCQLREDWMLVGLLHDAMESVIGDITSPVKHHPNMEFIRTMEEAYLNKLYWIHGIYPSFDAVRNLKDSDAYAMSLEIKELGYYDSELWKEHIERYPALRYEEDVKIFGMPNNDAEILWLDAYNGLQEARNYGKIRQKG